MKQEKCSCGYRCIEIHGSAVSNTENKYMLHF